MDKTLIVVPTFNEKENISELINSLTALFEGSDVLIVDDSSPDGTSELVQKHPLFNNRVYLLKRKGKLGRGSAIIAGFQFAFERNVYSHIVEMDADFSHDPRELHRILEKTVEADVIIGSRYMRGSKIIGWNLKRRVFSKFANIYARIVLGVPISDYTNGYRCYNCVELKKLNFKQFKSSGYITLSEIAYKMHKNGCRFAEVPITFVNRRRGMSNLSTKEVKEAFLLLPKLRFS